jgi:ferredoxin-type protein NapH
MMTKMRALRLATASAAALIVVSGVAGELRYGGLCSLNLWIISVTDSIGFWLRSVGLWRLSIDVTCPLGYLERSLAARELLPEWPYVLLVLLSVIVLGRVFCAWLCPAVLSRRVFIGKKLPPKRKAPSSTITWTSYSSYAVLGGVLVASYVFRFPVFCFFCPVGLFFGSLYALIRVFSPNTPGLELVVFPLMLGVELWGLKSWCRSFCPLGALLSIVGNLNPFFVPTITKNKCLGQKGINCQVCERACPEGIDLDNDSRRFDPHSCTKCFECSDRCPLKGIKFPLRASG